MQTDVIEVTVDKSHLVTIGERLYGESVELIRELVNNAYDADATQVHITINPQTIIVEDNGNGMDLEGLRQYFNIGSSEKRRHPKSPILGRDRIGEFGIGKFATLSACSRFEVWTKKGDFQGRVIFDKKEWEKSGVLWQLPLLIETMNPELPSGTKVTLSELNKEFDLSEVEKRLIETIPIKVKDFTVFLNGKQLRPKLIAGHRVPFLEGTEFGVVHGEIIITSQSDADRTSSGIECKVKQVTIKREFFGIEKWGVSVAARVTGEIHADFLPITSDRTDFIRDTPQYFAFLKVMEPVMERVKKVLEEVADQHENRRARRTLSEVLERVKRALILNPDYCPEGLLPLGNSASEEMGQPGYISGSMSGKEEMNVSMVEEKEKRVEKPRKKRKQVKVKRLTPTAVVKHLKMGNQGISCCLDHFGKDGPESVVEGTIIYINRDHPLFVKHNQRKDTYLQHMARLLTQEIALMKNPRNPRQAFERQSKLLKDALAEE